MRLKKMRLVNYNNVKLEIPKEKGIKDVKLRWLISDKDGAKNFAMRLFEIKSGGYTPLHQHDWEHEVFILEGEGHIKNKNGDKPFSQGDVLFIKPMEWHQFINSSKKLLKFLCLIPIK
jgi:quercetin dioxygenase-like cupin family protein